MMGKLYGYVGVKLMNGILLSSCALSGLAFISALIKKIGRRGSDLSMVNLLNDIVHLLPYMVYEMLPLGCIIGTTLVLHSLAANGELIIMRCLGLSGWRMASLIATPSLLIGLTAIFWIDYIAVPAYKAPTKTYNHIWLEDKQGLLHIGKLFVPAQGQPVASNLTRFVFSEEKLTSVVTGDQTLCSTRICEGKGRPRWGNSDALVVSLDRLKDYGLSSRSQRLIPLWRTVQRSELYNPKAWQLWQRLSNPLFFAALALLVGVFVLYYSPRSSVAKPIIIAIGLGLLADTLLKITTFSAMLYQLPVWLGFLAPISATILGTVLLILRKA